MSHRALSPLPLYSGKTPSPLGNQYIRMEAEKRRLFLTLCRSNGPYRHAIVPLPDSYSAAIHEAVQIFYPGGQMKQNEVILKYAMKRVNGTGAWASLRPRDWSNVVAQDGEIGVFIRTDSIDLPYEPGPVTPSLSWKQLAARTTKHAVLSGGSNTAPPRPPKTLYLIYQARSYASEQGSAVIEAPPTYVECQNLAYEALRKDIPLNAKATDLQLETKRDTNFPLDVNWSVITPSAYNAVLASTTGRLDIRVSTPGLDYDYSYDCD